MYLASLFTGISVDDFVFVPSIPFLERNVTMLDQNNEDIKTRVTSVFFSWSQS